MKEFSSDDPDWEDYVLETARRLMGMEKDSDARRLFLLDSTRRISPKNGYDGGWFLAAVLIDVLTSFDGIIDGHQDPDHIRTLIAMRSERAQLIDEIENGE